MNKFSLYTIYTDDADWDEYHGFTVIAESEEEARKLAEKSDNSYSCKGQWLDNKKTRCTEIKLNKSQVVSSDFNAG